MPRYEIFDPNGNRVVIPEPGTPDDLEYVIRVIRMRDSHWWSRWQVHVIENGELTGFTLGELAPTYGPGQPD